MLKDGFCTRESSRCIILRGLRSVRHFGPRVDCPAPFVSTVVRTTSFQPPTEGCGFLVETLALAAGLPKRTGPRQAAVTPRMQRLTGYRNSESSTKSQLFKKRRGNFCQKQKLFLTLRHNGDMRLHACSKPPCELGWGMPGLADKSL